MRPLRVLLVDDNELFLASASAFLSNEPGVEVVASVRDPWLGVRLSRDTNPDVVLMDLLMPELSGIEALQMIKAIRPSQRVYIVTLHDGPEYRSRALAANADGFICKSGFVEAMSSLVASSFGVVAAAREQVHP